MLINYHLHTGYSADARGTIDEYCKQAVKSGFIDICFTNHHEFNSVYNKRFFGYSLTEEKLGSYISEIEKARKNYPQLKIKFGVELGYQKEYRSEIKKFSKSHDFDYVLGSVHFIDGIPLHLAFSEKKNNEKVAKIYFNILNEAIKLNYSDSIGHFDIVRRYCPEINLSNYSIEAKKCIEAIKENDLCVEINTKGWEFANKDSYPSSEALKLMLEMGLTKFTVGSDSHSPEGFSSGIKKGISLLKKNGVNSICGFSKRKPIFYNI